MLSIILLAGISQAQFQQNITFNESNFNGSLINAVEGNVKGYQYVLIRNGQIVAERARGKAQNAADFGGNGLNMTTSTPTNIGSLAKFLSGTAMLNLMVKPAGPGGSWDAGLSLSQKLNRDFTTMVPNVWKTGLSDPKIMDISIRQLLQHRSGFDKECNGQPCKQSNRTVLGFLKDNDGFYPNEFGVRQYSNVNFVLTGYLITMYEYPDAEDYYNQVADQQNYNEREADEFVRWHAGWSMHNIMKDRIWDQMNPQIEPNCDAANTLQNSAAYGYNSKNDNTQGFIWSEVDSDLSCKGQGGYYMSARDLANYLAHFSATDLIVTDQARDLMYSDSWSDAQADNRLVWSSTSVHEWFTDNFGMPRIVWSDGAQDNYRNVIIRLPQSYYLVLLTNSPELSTGQLKNAGVAAFRAGMEHNFN